MPLHCKNVKSNIFKTITIVALFALLFIEYSHRSFLIQPSQIPVFTFITPVRNPILVGLPIVRMPGYILILEKKLIKTCTEYSPQCQKEDLWLAMEVLCERYDYFFIHEDDFELCIPEENIVQLIKEKNITDKIVNVAYGLGLVYIPKSKCNVLKIMWRTCVSTPDDCFNLLPISEMPVHFNIPLAVHRSKNQESRLHKDVCDLLCFVSCHDAGHYSYKPVEIQDWLQERNITFKLVPNLPLCNAVAWKAPYTTMPVEYCKNLTK